MLPVCRFAGALRGGFQSLLENARGLIDLHSAAGRDTYIVSASPIEIINLSLNQTLGRTLVTSLTTLLVLFALLLAGGEMIRGFALALTIGIVVGTYSSIYVAANILVLMNITREDLLIPEKEGLDAEEP